MVLIKSFPFFFHWVNKKTVESKLLSKAKLISIVSSSAVAKFHRSRHQGKLVIPPMKPVDPPGGVHPPVDVLPIQVRVLAGIVPPCAMVVLGTVPIFPIVVVHVKSGKAHAIVTLQWVTWNSESCKAHPLTFNREMMSHYNYVSPLSIQTPCNNDVISVGPQRESLLYCMFIPRAAAWKRKRRNFGRLRIALNHYRLKTFCFDFEFWSQFFFVSKKYFGPLKATIYPHALRDTKSEK